MASDLAQHLQQIAAAAGIHATKRQRGKASLLYNSQAAADIGTDAIYEIGLEGFEQLCRLDARFQAYAKSLYSQGTIALDRTQLTAEDNANLDNTITAFCRLLCAYFLLPPAFKALEYLIRKFKVHERNVHALMNAALPYHATNEFVRLVQILHLEHTPFAFLTPMQSSGAALPRPTLLARCKVDKSLLTFIMDMARDSAISRLPTGVLMPFYAALVCEMLDSYSVVEENTVTFLLPYLQAGLSQGPIADYRSATYMVLAQLAVKATMSSELAGELATNICRSASQSSLHQALLLLAHLAATQDHLQALSDKAFSFLIKHHALDLAIKQVAHSARNFDALLKLLLPKVLLHSLSTKEGFLLKTLIASTALSKETAYTLTLELLQHATIHSSDCEGIVEGALRALDLHCPDAVDDAINTKLNEEAQWGGSTPMIGVLERVFAGSSRSKVLGDAGTTLQLAIDAPAAALRRLAVLKLDDLEKSTHSEFIQASLLRRLQDDDPGVVQAALGVASLLELRPTALMEALKGCTLSALEKVSDASLSIGERSAAKGILRKVIHVVSGEEFLQTHLDHSRDCVPIVLSCLLMTSSKLQSEAVAASVRLSTHHPLLAAFKGLKAHSSNHLTQGMSIVNALAQQAQRDARAMKEVEGLIVSGNALGRVLALAVASECLSSREDFVLPLIEHLCKALLNSPAEEVELKEEKDLCQQVVQGHMSLAQVESMVLRRALTSLSTQHVQNLLDKDNDLIRLFSRLHTIDANMSIGVGDAFVQSVPSADLLLSEIFGRSLDDSDQELDAAVQAKAVVALFSWLKASGKKKIGVDVRTLSRLFCTLSHPDISVREGALKCMLLIIEPKVSVPGMSKEALAAIGKIVIAKHDAILMDPEALHQIVLSAIAQLPSAAAPPATTGRKKKVQSSSDSKPSGAALLKGVAVDSLKSWMLEVLRIGSDQERVIKADMHAAYYILSCLSEVASSGELLLAGQPLLQKLTSSCKPKSTLEQQLASDLAEFYNAEALSEISVEQIESVVNPTLLKLLHVPATDGLTLARQTALSHTTAAFYTTLGEATNTTPLIAALLHGAAKESEDASRKAFSAALEGIPISAKSLLPLLFSTAPTAREQHLPRKRTTMHRDKVTLTSAEDVQSCLSILELLQWKEGIGDALLLVPTLQDILDELLHSGSSGDAAVSTVHSYMLRLTLSALHLLATRHWSGQKRAGNKGKALSSLEPFDLELAVRCSKDAPDTGTRTEALALVTVLASAHPRAALDHVLDVVSVVGGATDEILDPYSSRVAASTLAAVVPAWIQGGSMGVDKLVAAVVLSTQNALPHRRISLLHAVAGALPEVQGRSLIILALLEEALALPSQTTATEAATAVLLKGTTVTERLQTTADLLKSAMGRSRELPNSDIVKEATAFSALNIASMSLTMREGAQNDLVAVMQQALLQYQRLGDLVKAKKILKEDVASTSNGISALVKALEGAMESTVYIKALISLIETTSLDRVRRRAIGLLTTKVDSQDESAGLEALSACDSIVRIVGDPEVGSMTKQVALRALGTIAGQYADKDPKLVTKTVPAVLRAINEDGLPAIRGSALAAVGAIASALGPRFVPMLPSTMTSIMGAADRSIASLSCEESEPTLVELTAALAALASLADGLAPFLAPYTDTLLRCLLSPIVLNESQNAAEIATAICTQLATQVPARLLMEPLLEYLDAAVESGATSIIALLEMVRTVIDAMDNSTVVTHHESVFAFLIKALDLRRKAYTAGCELSRDADLVENTAVGVLGSLTLRLSESRFKPLFLRLVEWCRASPSDQLPGPSQQLRLLALFAAVNALAEQLRSVFIPYFKPLMDLCLESLSHSGVAGDHEPPAKKRQRASSSLTDTPADATIVWLLRLRIIRALHRCFMYDTVDFIDEARYERTMQPLVDQLSNACPAATIVRLEKSSDGCSRTLEHGMVMKSESIDFGEFLDVFARSTVAAIAQLAVTVGSDTKWKPLNHAVCLATRSLDIKARLAALCTLRQLAEKLSEEYLVLLPETLPFLAELLEDAELPVEAGARDLVKRLEEVSGESLADYLK